MLLKNAEENEDEDIEVSSRLFNLIILGIILISVGIAVVVVASVVLGSGSVGAVIFIGPFPIVFGSGPNATWLILIGIILAVVSVIIFVIMNRRLGRFSV
jgi:uncharacterized membrane protein